MPDLQQLRLQLNGDTGRLAGAYLAIIMALTIVFSGIIYAISSSQYDRALPPRGGMSQFDDLTRSAFQDLLEERAHQARTELFVTLLLLNLAVLLGGAVLSYFLARKSLEPIEDSMRAQSQFVTDASHELRTPLTALQITNEVALRKKKLTEDQARELIGHNLAETIKLRNLSESLLGLAKQDTAGTKVSELSVPELVLDTIQTFAPLAAEKHITITHDIPAITATANESALTQILRILLDNALKYSPDGSTIRFSASTKGDRVVVAVADEGPGIPAEHQAKIFNRFYRVDQSRSSQHIEGSGLGLAIAKAIAERHGYDLSVQSNQGSGSTFTITT